jgi:VCBS repeat protein
MRQSGDRAGRVRGVVRTMLVAGTGMAAAVGVLALAPTASAERAAAAPWEAAGHTVHLDVDRAGGMSTKSTGGGARSGDFTLDGKVDILARNASTGNLVVYPHSGTYNGTATFHGAVIINGNWGAIRWIGQGDMNADGAPDVVYVDSAGVMRVAPHTGTFNGTGTISSGVVIGTGWTINDLIFTDDFNGDGFVDILARRAGTGDTNIYFNNGGISGTTTLQAPQLLVSGGVDDVEQTMGDFTGDGLTDLLFVQKNGVMGLFDFEAGETGATYTLGYGWETINRLTLADVNLDGWVDVLGRRASDSTLQGYRHSTQFAPDANGIAYSTLQAPQLLGTNWNINNVIT